MSNEDLRAYKKRKAIEAKEAFYARNGGRDVEAEQQCRDAWRDHLNEREQRQENP